MMEAVIVPVPTDPRFAISRGRSPLFRYFEPLLDELRCGSVDASLAALETCKERVSHQLDYLEYGLIDDEDEDLRLCAVESEYEKYGDLIEAQRELIQGGAFAAAIANLEAICFPRSDTAVREVYNATKKYGDVE